SRLGGFFVSIVRKKYISKLQSTINNTLHAQSSILVVFPLYSRGFLVAQPLNSTFSTSFWLYHRCIAVAFPLYSRGLQDFD
ncbi:hypothetical protein P7L86_23410, partial [Vibrio parahaemolyticus]|nr:hypothetical protein [Vibrio parahaemolyticus]